jgi:predicted nuclease of predicted toxin-antitoxin system
VPRTIRFHLDENCDPRIAAGLRLLGADVTTTPEAGLLTAPDEDHLAFGLATGRVVVTQDQDFLAIGQSGTRHRVIVYYPQSKRSIGQVIRGLHLIWEVLESDEMVDQVEYI